MKLLIISILFWFFALSVNAQIRLPRLVSDGMVLQRDKPVTLWGWASAGEKVTVKFKSKTFTTQTGSDGKWILKLPAQKAGGPYEMTFKGTNELTVKNILFGDVWICAGQSNMELTLVRPKQKYATDIAASKNPMIRHYTVPDHYDFNHTKDEIQNGGKWLEADPKNVLEFSAVGYFFAKELYDKYKVPIGLLNIAVGGAPAESWLSEDSLKKFERQYKIAVTYKDQKVIDSTLKSDRDRISNWHRMLNEKDEGLVGNWKDPLLDDAGWIEMNMPGYWADGSIGFMNGSMWFRKKIEVPRAMIGALAKIELGAIVDADSVFINGVYIGNTSYQYPPRRYNIPANVLKEGTNLIVIRVINQSGRGGFVPDRPYHLSANNDTIDLKGKWKLRPGAKMEALAGQTFIQWQPLGLYNGMLFPVFNYTMKGVIWYQGESNAWYPGEYQAVLKTMINTWRSGWNQGDFPFLIVQLANWMAAKSTPSESGWAATRQAQLSTSKMKNTALAVAVDLGQWNELHPENKKDVGHRLALLARRLAYGEKKLVASGPIYKSMKIDGNKIILSFSETGGGLIAKGGEPLRYFAIAGVDKKYVWANAEIKGDKVIVWSDEIANPVSVRYAWADNPEGTNLYNKEGLPASPFGTHDKF